MRRRPVIDLSDLGAFDASGREPSSADRRQWNYLGAIVQAATASPAGETIPSPLPCRRRPEGNPCRGRLQARQQDVPSRIDWHCPACGDCGVIVDWRGTIWDLASQPSAPPAGPDTEFGEVVLPEEQYQALRKHVHSLDLESMRIVAGARLTPSGVTLSGSLEDLEDLAGHVAFSANHTSNRWHRTLFEGVLDRLDQVLRDHPAPAEESLADLSPADALMSLVRAALADRQITSPEAFDAALDQAAEGFRVHLSRVPGAPVKVDPSLTLPDLGRARVLTNARVFLAALVESGGTRATTTGNLNRAFVGRMVETMTWPAGFLEELHRFNKVINEMDAFPLHVLRVLLDLAGLVKRRAGVFRTTRRGATHLADEQAGELYALLFQTHFQRFNLAYLDRMAEAPGFQAMIPHTLFRFARSGKQWKSPEKLVKDLLSAHIRAEVPQSGSYDPLPWMLESRLLDPLESFGLADRREEPTDKPYLRRRFYRKTPLYDRFLRFEPRAIGFD